MRLVGKGVAAVVVVALVVVPAIVAAQHLRDWTHDHSSKGVPYRPDGYHDLVRVFGSACSGRANDARTPFPHINGRWDQGYVYHHPYIARNVGYNIRTHIAADHRNGALDYGEYGYSCRRMRGGSNWSTHAYGAAIDTNTKRNPAGQSFWNGRGADGVDHGSYIPNTFKGSYPGHKFRWGRSWNDPHHFQYVTGY